MAEISASGDQTDLDVLLAELVLAHQLAVLKLPDEHLLFVRLKRGAWRGAYSRGEDWGEG